MEKEIMQAIKEDKLYDYILNNYLKMSKQELRDLILEIYYILRVETIEDTKENIEMYNENIIEYLKSNRDWEE